MRRRNVCAGSADGMARSVRRLDGLSGRRLERLRAGRFRGREDALLGGYAVAERRVHDVLMRPYERELELHGDNHDGE